MLLLLSLAWGAPEDVPLEAMAQRQLWDSGIHRLTGQPGSDPFAVQADIAQLAGVDAGLAIRLDSAFSSFSAPDTEGVRWGVREWGRVAGGALQPVNFLGDDPGLGSLRGGLDFWARTAHFSLMLRPELRLDVGCDEDPVCGQAPLTEGSLGVHWGGFDFRVGTQDRSAGPGARGHLILGRDIRPWPAATVAYSHNAKVGKFAGEWGLGWLPGERGDVQNPGLQHMDLRWSPAAWLELGFSRATLFAGTDRPWPSFVELLLPISSHVSGDPNQLQADSNEIAALDFRLNVPLKGVFHRLSLWYEYGGEDMIVGNIGPVPVPQLAGPANLAGGELSVGDWSLTAERALLLDDTFRWYTSHRVYHEGFVRDGHAIGHPHGGDADSWWFAAAWYGLPVGAEVFHERVRRVGVVESNPKGVYRFASEELSWQAGARAWLLPLRGAGVGVGGHWELGLSVGQVQAENFVPGQDAWRHRAWIAFSRAGP